MKIMRRTKSRIENRIKRQRDRETRGSENEKDPDPFKEGFID